MKPYYQKENVTVYKSDFRAVVETLPREVLVITDPPYNIGFEYDVYKDLMPDEDYIDMLCELQRFQRVVITSFPVETMKYVVHALGTPSEVVAWCYNSRFPKRFRLISFYGCKPDYDRIKQPYKNQNDYRIKELMSNGASGTGLYEWWDDIPQASNTHKGKENISHPCPVPEALQKRIITLCADKDDVIFDPFGGSLTTCKAAQDLGHKSIACEISENYIREGVNRLAQPSFFTPSNNACSGR